MRFSLPPSAFRLALWLSVGAILVMGAAPKKQEDDFSDDHFDQDNHHPLGPSSPVGLVGSGRGGNGASTSSAASAAASASSSSSSGSGSGSGSALQGNGGNLFSQMTNSLTGIIGGGSGSSAGSSALGSAVALGEPLAKAAQSAIGVSGGSGSGSGKQGELSPVNSIQDWGKLLLNPIELTKHISAHFKIPLDKLVEKIGSSCVYGLEALLQPFVACIKIVEKVFQPDSCRLKFVCKLTSHLHFLEDKVLKLSPAFYESSSHLKALSHGLAGKDCELLYPNCGEPTLNKPFAELKDLNKDYKVGARGLSRQPVVGSADNVAAGSNKQVAATNEAMTVSKQL